MSRSLDGVSVLLTRRPEDNAALAAKLRARGADVRELPCVRTEPLADPAALRDALGSLGPDDLLVVTSRAGAEAVVAAGVEIRAPMVRTAERGTAFAERVPLPRGTVLLARSDRALPELARVLRRRGARVREAVAYRTVPGTEPGAAAALRAEEIDVVAFASPSAVDGFAGAAAGSPRCVVVIGETTARRARERLGRVDAVASAPTTDALVAAIESTVEVSHVARA